MSTNTKYLRNCPQMDIDEEHCTFTYTEKQELDRIHICEILQENATEAEMKLFDESMENYGECNEIKELRLLAVSCG